VALAVAHNETSSVLLKKERPRRSFFKKNMRHVIQSQQFTRSLLESLFKTADLLEERVEPCLNGKIMATLFYEPSTRTRFSFESAMLRLGGNILTTENAREFSSAAKGETIEDTIRVTANYTDLIVLRHHEEGAAHRASLISPVPVINAGDGKGQHPTQALLDLYTIQRELGTADNITVGMVGDLKHGRTIRSLSYLLGKYSKINIIYISPEALRIESDITDYLKRHNVSYREQKDLESALPLVDVLYVTRIQKERFSDQALYEKLKNSYHLTPTLAQKMKKQAIIMHPLPRLDEIDSTVDNLPQATYFKQAHYGLLVRMALLKNIFHQ